jgi:hypothetical protein
MIKSNRRAVTLLACVAIVMGMATTAQAQQEGVYTIPSYKFEAAPQHHNDKIGYVFWDADRRKNERDTPGAGDQ